MTCRKKVAPSLCVAIHPWWCRRSSAIVMCRVLDMLMRSVSWSNVYLESLAAVYMPPTSPSGTEKCHKIRWSSGLDFPLRGRRWPFLNPSCSILFGFVFAWKKKKPNHHVLPLNRWINPMTNAIIKRSLGPGTDCGSKSKQKNCLFDGVIDLAV